MLEVLGAVCVFYAVGCVGVLVAKKCGKDYGDPLHWPITVYKNVKTQFEEKNSEKTD